MKWKTVENNKRRLVHQLQKIDNFQDKPAPILRFRSTFNGPCIGDPFASFIMDLEQRKKWDVQIDVSLFLLYYSDVIGHYSISPSTF